jgi:hypothetical protein
VTTALRKEHRDEHGSPHLTSAKTELRDLVTRMLVYTDRRRWDEGGADAMSRLRARS